MTRVFNNPFELGMRMVFLLLELFPRKADIQQLVYLDYAVVYSGDFGGPESLHTPVPLRGGEYLSRREVIEEGLYLMAVHGLVDVVATKKGILYSAGENASTLVGLIGGVYGKALIDRCRWVADHFANITDDEMEVLFGVKGALWGAHLIGVEKVGAEE